MHRTALLSAVSAVFGGTATGTGAPIAVLVMLGVLAAVVLLLEGPNIRSG